MDFAAADWLHISCAPLCMEQQALVVTRRADDPCDRQTTFKHPDCNGITAHGNEPLGAIHRINHPRALGFLASSMLKPRHQIGFSHIFAQNTADKLGDVSAARSEERRV